MRRRLLIGLVIAGAAAAATAWWSVPPIVSTPSDAPQAASAAQTAKPDASFAASPPRAALGAPRGELFGRPPAPPSPPPAAAPQAPADPVAPPMPYRVAGRVEREGVSSVLLAKGETVLPVAEGDTLEGGYRVESIGAAEITLLYLPLGVRQRLLIATSAPASRQAQLRWEGPERVKAQTPFTVALRVTSEEPLRHSPMQVSFDAEVLEPLSVRPGKLFGDEGFAYRISPDGSISIGASGRARDLGQVAADAELVVFVFKPLRPTAATELKLTSLALQGAVGKPIAAGQLGPYRAAITP